MHWIDPDSLPEIAGRFERFLLNPHGEADGLMLGDGIEVHFPPHMAKDVVPAIENAPGALLRIRGVRPREGDVFAAVAINFTDGSRVEDRGPPKKPEKDPHHPPPTRDKREDLRTEGVVRRALHGPKGEVRGALLDNGVILRFPPHEAAALSPWLIAGATVAAKGNGVKSKLGTVIEVREIGANGEKLHAVGEGKPTKKPKSNHGHRLPHQTPA